MTFAIPDLVTGFLLTFARVGTLVMLLPGIGERMILGRLRLGIALFLTLALLPLSMSLIPPARSPSATIGILVGEIAVGLVLGLAARMVVAAMQIAGTIVAQQLGLSFAMSLDPTIGGQEASIGNFLTLTAVAMIFATDLHHLALGAIRESYAILPPVGIPEPGDAVQLAIGAVGRGFSLALRISAPFIVFGILINAGLGILSRLMPQLQVFFIGMPLSILIGMLVLLASLGLMMQLYLGDLGGFLRGFGSV